MHRLLGVLDGPTSAVPQTARSVLRWGLFLIIALIPAAFGFVGGNPTSLSFRLTRESEPYVQTVTGWMVENTVAKIVGAETVTPATPDEVRDYFALAGRLAQAGSGGGSSASNVSALRAQIDAEQPHVEAALQLSVAEVAEKAGLGFRIGGIRLLPPVFFRFESPPNLLVVSPRDRISRVATVLLKPRLSVGQMEQIEEDTASADLSTLVTQIGGLGVYPSMVPENSDPKWTIQTVAHEWTHQFLAFRPLGWRYALGDEEDPRMITVNETVAEMVGTELGNQVYAEYYPAQALKPQPTPPRVDTFRQMMRDIRTRVDQLLGEGQVQEAESYMDASRQELAAKGYYIRKLNQAYFAFYGSYAEDPSAAGKTGTEISDRARHLRQTSASLGDFLWTLSDAGDYAEFLRIAPVG